MSNPVATATIDPDAERLLQGRLEPDETICWAVRPEPSAFVARALPGSLLGLGLLLLAGSFSLNIGSWMGEVWSSPGEWLPVALLGGLGILVLFAPLLAAWVARGTVYAVTDRRAVILSPKLTGGSSVDFFSREQFDAATAVGQPDGTSDVALASTTIRCRRGTIPIRRRRGTIQRTIGFFAVPAEGSAIGPLAREDPSAHPPEGARASASGSIPAGIVLLAIGCGLTWMGIRQMEAARRPLGWPTAPGKVWQASIATRPGRHPTRVARIYYSFRVGDDVLMNSRVAYGDSGASSRAAELVRRYPAGTAVTVSYNPLDPGDSVIEPWIHRSAWSGIGLGISFTIVCLGVFWNGMSRYRSRPFPSRSGVLFM
jgi:hypothetical protein